ncbi:hypothetical protein EB052_01760, partial [bacterium]|nr:hypothetical protein [bacterium]
MKKTNHQPEAKKQQDKKQKQDPKFIFHSHLDKIGEIPVYYGFSPRKSPEIKKSDTDQAKSFLSCDFIDDEENHGKLPLHVEEKIALLR